jgi:wobble nucleotide-excising tRNase
MTSMAIGAIKALDEKKADKKDVEQLKQQLEKLKTDSPPISSIKSLADSMATMSISKSRYVGEPAVEDSILRFMRTCGTDQWVKKAMIMRACGKDSQTTNRNLYSLMDKGKVINQEGKPLWKLV